MGRAEKVVVVLAVLVGFAMGYWRLRSAMGGSEGAQSAALEPGETRALLQTPEGYTASPALSWSADGTKIALTRYREGQDPRNSEGRVYVVDVRTGRAREITGSWSYWMSPVFGASSDELILMDGPDVGVVAAHDLASGKERTLYRAENGWRIANAYVAPNMAWLSVALASTTAPDKSATVVADLRTGTRARLWEGTDALVSLSPWSPNSRLTGWTILNMSDHADPEAPWSFWIAGLPALHPRRIALPIGDLLVKHGCWAPDGARLVVRSIERNRLRVFVVDVTSGGSRTIVDMTGTQAAYKAGSAWSPDGRWIAYGEKQGPGRGGLADRVWLVKPDGSGRTQLLGPGDERYSELSWSPDGRQLAFFDGSALEIAEVP